MNDVTHARALEAAQRLINSHFGNDAQARTCVPAHSDDDDLVITRYIAQQREHQEHLNKLMASWPR